MISGNSLLIDVHTVNYSRIHLDFYDDYYCCYDMVTPTNNNGHA